MALSGAAVGYCVVGGLVLFSGVKGASISDTVKAALSGNLKVKDTQPIDQAAIDSALAGDIAAPGSIPSANVQKAQAYAKSAMANYGWTDQDYQDLVKLWNQESGWSNTAKNPTSGAYGIAQALGHAPGATVAQNKEGYNYPYLAANPPPWGTSDAAGQIDWGLGYIQTTYQSPSMAWAHEQQYGWY